MTPRLPPGTFAEPHATITKAGRWTWLVTIRDGLMQYGPDGYGWTVFGSRRAARKADRELARYLRKQARAEVVIRIGGAE